MKLERRQKVIGSLLGLTLVAAWFAPPKDENVVVDTTPRKFATVTSTEGAPHLDNRTIPGGAQMLLVHERTEEASPGSVFDAPPILKPAKVVTPPLPEAPPQAPPLPFRYLGRHEDANGLSLFVKFGEQDLVLKEGSVVAATYRVEKVADGLVTFKYLPLNQMQTLPISDSGR